MVALQKKVSYMRWSFYGSPFSQKLQYTFSKCIITIQDVLKKRKKPYNELKIEIYEFNQFSYSPKKFSCMRLRLFGAFCQNTYIYIYLFYVYFHRTGCPKNR